MTNVSGLQIALVGVVMMVARHYRLPLAESEVVAVIAGLISVGGIVWEWYRGWKSGSLTALGGRKV